MPKDILIENNSDGAARVVLKFGENKHSDPVQYS